MQQVIKLGHSPEEVAAMLGISRAVLYAEWREGRGPRFIKIRRRTIVTEQAIRDYLAEISASQSGQQAR